MGVDKWCGRRVGVGNIEFGRSVGVVKVCGTNVGELVNVSKGSVVVVSDKSVDMSEACGRIVGSVVMKDVRGVALFV